MRYAKKLYDGGQYAAASKILRACKELEYEVDRSRNDQIGGAVWGELAAEIMAVQDSKEWFSALKIVQRVTQDVENRGNFVSQMEHRRWLMHWSLYLSATHLGGYRDVSESFVLEKALAVVQLSCPYLLRYLVVAAIMNRRRFVPMKEVIRILQSDLGAYRDPIVEFAEALHVHYDYARAMQKLAECDAVVQQDFFLSVHRAEFFEAARSAVFENICRMHHAIDLNLVRAEGLLTADQLERLVAARQSSSCHVTIDATDHVLHVDSTHSSVQNSLAERVRGLAQRTAALNSKLAHPRFTA